MKRITNWKPSYILFIAMFFLTAIFFTACKKDDNNNTRTPVAGLMAFNLAPDKSPVGFSLSGNPLGNAPINYTSYTGVYLPVYTGSREVKASEYGTGATLAISNYTFSDSMYYSAFLIGANGNYKNVVVQDRFDSLSSVSGKAWVRYVNAIADSAAAPLVTIGSADANTFSENASYASVSPFKQVSAGTVNTSVSNNSAGISATRSITLEENKIYTILFAGQPNQADSSRAVQIRFIQNGTTN